MSHDATTAQTTNEAEVNQFLGAMLARSATDADFRATLLSSPRTAFAQQLGRDVSQVPPLNVAFVERTADVTIVLPPIVSGSLDDAALESVSGGDGGFVDLCIDAGKALCADIWDTLQAGVAVGESKIIK